MAGQEQGRPQRRDDGEPDDAPEPARRGSRRCQTSDIDNILDEIDGVLGVQRRGVRARVRPEGRPVTAGADSGRLPAAFLVPGSSSFTEFVGPGARPCCRRDARCRPGAALEAPHGTTIVTLTFAGGVVMAGDRRATMGNLIANRDMEKVFAADEYASSASPAPPASPSSW